MGVNQTTTYTCDQCQTKVSIEGGMAGGPAGWLPVTQAGSNTTLWFHQWACLGEYATVRAAA